MQPEKHEPATSLQQRPGLARIDTDPTTRRAETDPALPIGQEDRPTARRRVQLGRAVLDLVSRHTGLVLLIVAVLAVAGAILTAHHMAGRDLPAEPAKPVRPVKVMV